MMILRTKSSVQNKFRSKNTLKHSIFSDKTECQQIPLARNMVSAGRKSLDIDTSRGRVLDVSIALASGLQPIEHSGNSSSLWQSCRSSKFSATLTMHTTAFIKLPISSFHSHRALEEHHGTAEEHHRALKLHPDSPEKLSRVHHRLRLRRGASYGIIGSVIGQHQSLEE